MTRFRTGFAFVVTTAGLLAATTSGCSSESTTAPETPAATSTAEVLAVHPHDPNAFTQGLEIDGDRLYESTGRVGESWVRSTAVTDPSSPTSGPLLARADLEPPLFGEGITVFGNSVWQLTWKNGVAIERDKDSLAELRRVPLDTEGWGICSFDDRLITSDGSSTLTVRDPHTFEATETVSVTQDGHAVDKLNELECTENGSVLANVWTTDTIVAIDPGTGDISAAIDASALRDQLDTAESTRPIDVLNGIAQIPGTDRLLVTGKYWPQMFEIRYAG